MYLCCAGRRWGKTRQMGVFGGCVRAEGAARRGIAVKRPNSPRNSVYYVRQPASAMARGPSTPRYGYQSCKIDQTNGVVHYHGVTLDGEYTVHGIIPGQLPIDRTMPVTGLYLRPCDGK